METRKIKTDVLIIGGGTAGCFAAITLGRKSNLDVVVAEKANIRRSGCLAAGVNAINAYITKGRVPQDYVDYAKRDADGIVREDLLLSMSERLNHVNITDFKVVGFAEEEAETGRKDRENKKSQSGNRRIAGAWGFDVNEEIFYDIDADAVICATGGAAGLYRPNNPGFSRHKMWYPPFNTGAGYAMGILAGAEMTTFEMRFIALRCKDTIAPTGTIAQGVGARQVNCRGEVYEDRYGLTTSQRVYGTVMENREGRGPCCLRTEHISGEQEQDLYKAYLNMAPGQTLKWLESGKGPSCENVEIEGTEPYIVGGHTASGYWVDQNRRTTLNGLYAAGDVAGGCPQKYVTGALAEGEIAAEAVIRYLTTQGTGEEDRSRDESLKAFEKESYASKSEAKKAEYESFLKKSASVLTAEQLEETMQKIMDQYAGGISTDYQYNETKLKIASEKIAGTELLVKELSAENMDDLLRIYELKERLVVCQAVIAHLLARKETRWHSFAENTDYPQKSDEWQKYVNSRMRDGKIEIIYRDLVTGGKTYEHSDSEK